jgi:thiamine biosynthesis lipoprotein
MTEHPQETCLVSSNCSPIEGMMRFSHEAMATTFELLIVHEDECYARQAAMAAFNEVDRLEEMLSRFLESSDVTRINGLPANQALRLGLETFECLKIAERVYSETNGAFDITIGNLLKCWRNEDGKPHSPSPEEIDFAKLRTGTNLLQLNEAEHTVKVSASGVQIDLGGIGKGYAVDRIAELLRDWSIDIALISGGYSSVLALDAPPGKKGWPLTLTNPDGSKEILARPSLRDAALSGSGVQRGGHIIDPRTCRPVEGRLAAWSSAPVAATADALSTAFIIMGLDEIEQYCKLHPDTLAMVILDSGSGVARPCGEAVPPSNLIQGQDGLATPCVPPASLWRGRPGLASRRHPAGGKNKGKMPSPRKQGQDALATIEILRFGMWESILK